MAWNPNRKAWVWTQGFFKPGCVFSGLFSTASIRVAWPEKTLKVI